jgi:uncharacterized membrane protein
MAEIKADPGRAEDGGARVSAPRADWLDALRGLAVLGMIETHTVNTLLAPGWREGEAFTRLMYANGLVAPAFLWIAGYAHGLGWRRRAAGGGAGWMRTTKRLLWILALGYLIHLPLPGTGATWKLFFGVDVLQCLAASLLATVAVERWMPKLSGWVLGVGVAAAVALGALPPSVLNRVVAFWPLEAWIDQSGASLFPLVPWAAFVFLGVLMARRAVPWWGWAGLGAALVALPSPPYVFKSHPTFFFERFGWLVLGAAVVRGLGGVVRFPRWVCWVGRESLGMYLAHLALLYLVPTARWVGPSLPPAATAASAVGLTVLSAGLVMGWRRAMAARARPAG